MYKISTNQWKRVRSLPRDMFIVYHN